MNIQCNQEDNCGGQMKSDCKNILQNSYFYKHVMMEDSEDGFVLTSD